MYRTTFPLQSPGAFTLYRCRGNYCVILHGIHLVFWEGDVNEALPGACPPGHIHAVIYKRLTSTIYTQLVGCLLCTLWKGLGVVGDGNFGLVAMADVTTVLSIATLQSLHSPGHISESQLMWEYVSAGCWAGITIYGTQFVLSRTGYCTCLWDTAQTEPRHPRHSTGLHLAAAQLAASPHVA